MDQRNFEEKPVDVWTGQNERFLQALQKRIRQADRVDVIISFVMESGVRALLKELKEVRNLRILTGSYMNITQPWALRMLKEECHPGTQLRFFQNSQISFHPKSWIFHYPEGIEVIVGSSNLSWSALTTGVEWNCSLKGEAARAFANRFEELFELEAIPITDGVLDDYSRQWKKPPVSLPEVSPEGIHPRGVQIEALYALEQARKNGLTKGLVQAATGVGKTYLAAFDSRTFQRILFIAHREEILNQASASFHTVRPDLSQGRIDQNHKDLEADILFASVQSLARMVRDGKFKPDDFDYIVIDEFHHAVTDSYQTITNFFQPAFLLGLTATPDRLDGRDVYALCDYNVPYSINLQEAINKGILCPFRYYGIYDDTDYSSLSFRNGRYSPSELDQLYRQAGKRTELILGHYQKHHPTRALGFCASIDHAKFMTHIFNDAGISAAAVYTDSPTRREEAIESLRKGNIQVLFSVDMFNEGVDIPDVDAVMMLRPTESPTIFLQQLGRGLRKAPNKPYLTVLDFIGNYRNANRIPEFLTGQSQSNCHLTSLSLPLDCQIDFDLRLIDLFQTMNRNSMTLEQRFMEEYMRIQQLKGRRPTRMDLFTELDGELLDKMKKGKNPLSSYFGWLHDHNFLNEEEKALYDSPAKELIQLLETTNMSRLYKMPVLMAFLEENTLRDHVTSHTLLKVWKQFFARNENWKDLPKVDSLADYQKISDKAHLSNIRRNPVHFLETSSKGVFISDGNGGLEINQSYTPFLDNPRLIKEWEDVLEYRIMDYKRARLR